MFKIMVVNLGRRWGVTLASVLAILALTSSLRAQREMYPRKEGIVQPLQWKELPSWVTLDMELRGRTEEQTSLGYVDGKDRLYELTRVWGGVTVRPTHWMSGYLQFQDLHALGLPLRDVASNMRDTFDLRQGYLEVHAKRLDVKAGRQELRFGDERVIGISDWTNTSRTWDGFDLRVGDKNKIDLFSTSVVAIHPTSLNKHGAGLTFHGAVANLNSVLPKTSIQPFVLIRAVPRVISQQGTAGSETEVSFGSYYDTKLPFGFDSSGTGVLQRGSYSNDSIHAGAAIIRGGYAAGRLPLKPHIEGEYDYATGNPRTNAQRIGTYDQQYPSNHNAFGLVDLFGFQNIKQDRLNFSLAPQSNFLVLFQASSLHVASVNDGVYTGPGSILFKAPTGGFTHDGIGTEFDASAKYIFRKSFVTNVGVGHFFPGAVMTSSAHGAPLTLAYLQFTYRFKVDR
ncbi:alginate export family protein [Granulicella arctica]|uniref:alginate export family protein n=1 Tax=Granulicella arctica TaxID=940613 RepID=UPI0021E0FB1B|nr:alginate export family protein [Granulicella arctica]